MATALPSGGRGPTDIKSVVYCVLCKDEYTTQLLQLDCFHSCCNNCLTSSLRSRGSGTNFSCPQCETTTVIPGVGLQEELLQYKVKDIAKIFSNTKPSCDFCLALHVQTPSTKYCLTCKKYLCLTDVSRHEIIPDHEMITVEEVKSRTHLPDILTSKKAVCKVHSKGTDVKILEFFCKKCTMSACHACAVTKHKTCDILYSQDASQEFQQILQDKTLELHYPSHVCQRNLDKLQEMQEQVEKTGKILEDKCDKWGEKVKQMVDKMVGENKQKIRENICTQKKEIEKKYVSTKSTEQQFTFTTDYMEVFLQVGSSSDIMQKHDNFSGILDECLNQEIKFDLSLQNINIVFNTESEIQETLEKMMKVEIQNEMYRFGRPELDKCEVVYKGKIGVFGTGVTIAGEEIVVTGGQKVLCYNKKGEYSREIKYQGMKYPCDIDVHKDELYVCDSEIKKVVVMDGNGNIKRKIQLPSDVRGSELFISLHRSSGDVYVTCRGTNTIYRCQGGQDQAVPFITRGLSEPKHLCVTSNQEVIVSKALSHTVCKFSRDGRLLWEVGSQGSGNEQFYEPRGVCTDAYGHIFVADWYNHRVHCLSPDGTFCGLVDIGETIGGPYALTVKDDRLIITCNSQPEQLYVVKLKYK